MEIEIWKDIPDYEGYYQASNIGRIKSIISWDNKKIDRILKPGKCKNGYFIVVLRNNINRKSVYVHRMVAKTFIPNELNKRTVNHINSIRTDNRAVNLEWNTDSENIRHGLNVGMSARKRKINSYYVLIIKYFLKMGFKQSDIAYKLKLSNSMISAINMGIRGVYNRENERYKN
jgi:hypothetical protein